MKSGQSPHVAVATLIGDVIGSRESLDRAGLHGRLTEALAQAAAWHPAVRPLRITVGDEYQGVFATRGAALSTALRLRVALAPEVEVRHGVGWGPVSVLDEDGVEDGPGWWAARDAIDAVEESSRTATSRSRRTGIRLSGDRGPATVADPAVSAALLLWDERVSGLSPRALSVLRALLGGVPQKEIAAGLDISPSAVSQRVRADGLAALVAAHDLLSGL